MMFRGIVVLLFVAFPFAAAETGRNGNVTDIKFQLFTRKNLVDYDILEPNDPENLLKSHFDKSKPVKMYIHGYNGVPDSGYGIKDEYLLRDDVNFIAVDWRALSTGINYPGIALINVPLAGDYVGAFIDYLIEEGTSVSLFHLIGWSLGAHVAGNAGEAVTAGMLPRITGLDPAGPGYSFNDTDRRLDVTDADFVDIIHTNAGNIINGGIGFFASLGHIDFFPNGGTFQAGCDAESGNCHHRRCVQFFEESINSETGFWSVECDTWESYQNGSCEGNAAALMGDKVPIGLQGDFYLETNPVHPFAMGRNGQCNPVDRVVANVTKLDKRKVPSRVFHNMLR